MEFKKLQQLCLILFVCVGSKCKINEGNPSIYEIDQTLFPSVHNNHRTCCDVMVVLVIVS